MFHFLTTSVFSPCTFKLTDSVGLLVFPDTLAANNNLANTHRGAM